MATRVGTQKDLLDLLRALATLDHEAARAYQAAIEAILDPADKAQLQAFRIDHERHMRELRPFIERATGQGVAAASTGSEAEPVLSKGKLELERLIGDRDILIALKDDEDDTILAYERACERSDVPGDLRYLFVRNLADEVRHREYIEQRILDYDREAAGLP
jgi:hypothetical protein